MAYEDLTIEKLNKVISDVFSNRFTTSPMYVTITAEGLKSMYEEFGHDKLLAILEFNIVSTTLEGLEFIKEKYPDEYEK